MFEVVPLPAFKDTHVAYYGAGYASLQKLAALPDETKVYCGHEYSGARVRGHPRMEKQGLAG